MKNRKIVSKLSLDGLMCNYQNYALAQNQLVKVKGGSDSNQDYIGIVDIVDG